MHQDDAIQQQKMSPFTLPSTGFRSRFGYTMKAKRSNEGIENPMGESIDISMMYHADIDRKISDIEECLVNRRYDTVVRALLDTESNSKKNMCQAVSSLSNLVKQQHTRIQDYKTKLHDWGRVNHAIIQELAIRDEDLRDEQAIRMKIESELAECHSRIDILKDENEMLRRDLQQQRVIQISSTNTESVQDSFSTADNCFRDFYSTKESLTALVSPISPCNSHDESISKTLFTANNNINTVDNDKVSTLRKENIELQATNMALTKTISHQEGRLKKQLVRQQTLESLVHALQNQLQEIKETKEVENQLKHALLQEIKKLPVHSHDARPSSLLKEIKNLPVHCHDAKELSMSFDPCTSLEEKIQTLEKELFEERHYSISLRKQLDTATQYLRSPGHNDDEKTFILDTTTPPKLPNHRTVIMKNMLPSSSCSSRSSER